METSNLRAYTLMPEPNATYLDNYKNVPAVAPQMGSGSMGILMLISTLNFNTSVLPPQYSQAASQAGKAAYIQTGGQGIQDKLTNKAGDIAKEAYHAVGITDTEAGVVAGGVKIVRDKQIDVNGPKIYFIKTHLTVGQDHGSLGMGFNF